MIYKKSPEEIASMRRAGAILTDTLNRLEDALRPGITTARLDEIAEEAITSAGAKPSFKGYRGFPGSICASPNDVIVHGIPSADVVLEDGDIISIDVGVFLEGFHADSAWTFPVGEVTAEAAALLKTTEASLDAAIEQCSPGKRLGDVGHAVEQVAETAGYSVVREYVGHGVGRALHEEPQIPNYGPPGRREVLSTGMTLAIEPMVNLGGPETKVLGDGWTVVTADGSLSAHFEHTVAITPEGHEVLTRRERR
ncbi:MAG TPA: type I methionyl aminopeptidase [Actinomycetota bacterium]|jgi:methionyl aminopeptidase|nr:type I methionyl aminopeptidase [Actinomycetota bacterium]